MYRDFTGDPEAQKRLDEVTPLTPALEALGFARLGLVVIGREGNVEQVWSTRDAGAGAGAFAEPTWFPGKVPHLSFRTLFADGSIVETTQPRDGWVRWIPFWTRQHAPGCGYFYEERAGMPHELWLRHKERVTAHASARSTSPVPPSDVKTFIALAERAVRIAKLRTRWTQLLGLAALTAVAIPVTLRSDLFPSWVLPLTALVWALATWGVFALMRRGSIPKLEPAERLLARVKPG